MKKVEIPKNEWAPGIWAGSEGEILSSDSMNREDAEYFFGTQVSNILFGEKPPAKAMKVLSVDLQNRTVNFGEIDE